MPSHDKQLAAGVTNVSTWPGSLGKRWAWALSVLALAIIIRVVFFRSALGSDEVVYSETALRILHGEWLSGTYIGAIRYGINIPLALWMGLFGYGYAGLGGLFFTCSIAEVILAFAFARHLWGERAAIWSALILAVLPLNVALAGSLNPDPYLALVIELSFVTFYFAQQRESGRLYFLAGLLAGWVFWIKEVVIIYGVVFFLLAAFERRWGKGWLWFVLGGTLSVLSDLTLFWILYGDPLYQFRIVSTTVTSKFVATDVADTSFGPYFVYLFFKIYHTGLLGWLALAGCIAALRLPINRDMRFVLIWGCALLLAFSALPISLSPLKFISKQTNYMEIFLFPFALLAGWFVSRRRIAARIILGTALVGSGIILSAMEQQTIRIVTVNGDAAINFANEHPNIPVFGSHNLVQLSALNRALHGSLDGSNGIKLLTNPGDLAPEPGPSNKVVAYAIDDPQSAQWQHERNGVTIGESVGTCGRIVERLAPPKYLGLGRLVVGALYDVAALLPSPISARIRKVLDPIYQIQPATVYALTRTCAQRLANRR